MKPTSAMVLASVLLFTSGAFAQTANNGSSAPNMQTTRDGATQTPDASPTTHRDNSAVHSDRQDKKAQHKRSGKGKSDRSTSGGTGPSMNTTPDGVTPSPDATPTVR